MSPTGSFDDPILGQVTWDAERRWWAFTVCLKSGQQVRGRIDPSDEGLLENGFGLEAIRSLVAWVIEHDSELRQRITDAMFPGWLSGWYDEEIDDIQTPAEFREIIRLASLDITTTSSIGPTYNDGNLFGGHMIVLTIDCEGQFVYGPEIWG